MLALLGENRRRLGQDSRAITRSSHEVVMGLPNRSCDAVLAQGAANSDAADESGQLLGTHVAIPELEVVDEASAEEQHQLAALMDNHPDTVHFKDIGGRFLRINSVPARDFGLAAAEAWSPAIAAREASCRRRNSRRDEMKLVRSARILPAPPNSSLRQAP